MHRRGSKHYKHCPRCGRRFRRHKRDNSLCKPCRRISDRHWKAIRRARLHLIILAYLQAHPCPCGETDLTKLEFHHHATKTAHISQLLVNLASPARLQSELNACTVLCANCHRRQTHIDQRNYRWLAQMKKTIKPIARVKVPATIEVAWEDIAVRTSSGTVLRGMTMQRVETDLDAWLFYQRTGVNIVEKIIITYNSIAKQLKLDPSNKGKFSDKDKQKMLEFLENDKTFGLHAWIIKAATGKTSSQIELPENFTEEATKLVHTLYDKHAGKTNILPLQRLATFYGGATELDLDELFKAAKKVDPKVKDAYDAIDLFVRAWVKQNAEVFSVQAGANPDVKRLQKPGKGGKMAATGLEPFAAAKTRKGVKNKPKQVPAKGAPEQVVELDETEEEQEEEGEEDEQE